jgi:superfamily I DNA/RNA helicase
MQAVNLFREEIIDRNYPGAEADVILSTVHAAKGMEWDYVQVLNDMTNFPVILLKGYVKGESWQFWFQRWGDHAKFVYVACTQAKKGFKHTQEHGAFLG